VMNNVTNFAAIKELLMTSHVVYGKNHSMSLCEGKVYSRGVNSHGQLGHGDLKDREELVEISSLWGIRSIACGNNLSGALTEDGHLFMWGFNYYGGLGNGNNNNSSQPLVINMMDRAPRMKAISCSDRHVLAISINGDVYAWGYNRDGQLGLGHNKAVNTPQKIEGLENIIAVSAGGLFSLALSEEGEVYAFGNGIYGQLGNGTTQGSSVPIKIELSNIQAIYCGHGYSHAISYEGDIYSWGDNRNGQLGDGTTMNSSYPLIITAPYIETNNFPEKKLSDQHPIKDIVNEAWINEQKRQAE